MSVIPNNIHPPSHQSKSQLPREIISFLELIELNENIDKDFSVWIFKNWMEWNGTW